MIFGIFLLSAFYLYSYNHFDPWTAAKLYPSFALRNLVDLYNTVAPPFILNIYGPCSSLFYLPATLGNDPESSMWIALILNMLALLLFCFVIFSLSPNKFSTLSALGGLSFLFYTTMDMTTLSVYQIHHDLPCILYFTIFILFLRTQETQLRLIILAFCFLWLTTWTKLTSLPWLLIPLILRLGFAESFPSLKILSIYKIILIQFICGISILLIFGLSYGFSDLHFHLLKSTNSYPWRECNDLWGLKDEALLQVKISIQNLSFY